jgi:hypothetical protein
MPSKNEPNVTSEGRSATSYSNVNGFWLKFDYSEAFSDWLLDYLKIPFQLQRIILCGVERQDDYANDDLERKRT